MPKQAERGGEEGFARDIVDLMRESKTAARFPERRLCLSA